MTAWRSVTCVTPLKGSVTLCHASTPQQSVTSHGMSRSVTLSRSEQFHNRRTQNAEAIETIDTRATDQHGQCVTVHDCRPQSCRIHARTAAHRRPASRTRQSVDCQPIPPHQGGNVILNYLINLIFICDTGAVSIVCLECRARQPLPCPVSSAGRKALAGYHGGATRGSTRRNAARTARLATPPLPPPRPRPYRWGHVSNFFCSGLPEFCHE